MTAQSDKAPAADRLTRWMASSMSWRDAITASAVVVLTSGCVSPDHLSKITTAQVFSVKYVDSIGDPMHSVDRPVNAELQLDAIGGSTVGMPNETIQSSRISSQSSVEIKLASFETALSKSARPITAEAARDLKMEPKETKFARVSTLLSWRPPPDGMLSVAFVDRDDTKKSLGLFYFDRPCQLSGSHPSGNGTTVVYDINVETPGLVWVVSSREGKNRSVLRVAQSGVNPIVIIAPPANLKDGSFQIR